MKNVLLGFLISASSGLVTAQDLSQNYCTYGHTEKGPIRFEFFEGTHNPNGVRLFQAVLSEKLKVTMKRSLGWVIRYDLVMNFDNNLVIIKDSHNEFQPLRKLNISGTVEGKSLYCTFTPDF